MPNEDKSMSPEASPNSLETGKKQARRLNNIPIYMLCFIMGIVVVTLGMVAVKRAYKFRNEAARIGVKSAAAHARDLTRYAEGGIIEPAAPPPPEEKPVTPPPEDMAEKPAPKLPDYTEEIRKARQKRLRQFEAALDSPIKVQLDDTALAVKTVNDGLASLEQRIAALASQESLTYEERLKAIRQVAEGGGDTDYSDRADLSRLNHFTKSGAAKWRNDGTLEAPATRYIIRTGSVIPGTMITGISSDLPGQIIGQVSQNVYDSPTGRHLLIPQGSRLVGQYSSQIQYGQSRVFVVWERIIFPDGKALDLGAMPGSSGAGYAGFKDRVNNHYFRIFGSAIMLSAILAGVEMTQDNNGNDNDGNRQRMSDALSESLGQQLGGAMAEMLRKNMNIAPTLEIRPGYRFNVMLVRDLEFPGVYRGFDYAAR